MTDERAEQQTHRALDLERFLRLEQTVTQHGKEIEEYGGTLDHLVNTVDTILIPTQASHTIDIIECKQRSQRSHDYITKQEGVGAFVQRALLIVGAFCAVATLIMKLAGR